MGGYGFNGLIHTEMDKSIWVFFEVVYDDWDGGGGFLGDWWNSIMDISNTLIKNEVMKDFFVGHGILKKIGNFFCLLGWKFWGKFKWEKEFKKWDWNFLFLWGYFCID